MIWAVVLEEVEVAPQHPKNLSQENGRLLFSLFPCALSWTEKEDSAYRVLALSSGWGRP